MQCVNQSLVALARTACQICIRCVRSRPFRAGVSHFPPPEAPVPMVKRLPNSAEADGTYNCSEEMQQDKNHENREARADAEQRGVEQDWWLMVTGTDAAHER